jgi:Tfp pilus assembly protein PilO
MNRARFLVMQSIEMLGVPGVLGLGMLAFALAFAQAALRPAMDERDSLREREVRAAKRVAVTERRPTGTKAVEASIDRFVAWLPPADEARQQLLRLQAFADKRGLQLRSGEYRASPQRDPPVLRHQVLVPVKGKYADLRGFATEALAEVPSLALDAASLQRDSVSGREVEGRLQFSLYTGGT